MNILILMAGPSTDFEEKGYAYPKYLLEVEGKTIIQRVVESLCSLNGRLSFVIRKEDDEKYYLGSTLRILAPDATIHKVNNVTRGATCSALFAVDDINSDEELLIVNGDQLLRCGIDESITDFRKRNLAGGVIVFRSVHPRWSYVAVDENNLVNETSEKRPISNLATAGFYYYRHGKDFVTAAFENIRKDVNYQGRYYICSTYNELILKQQPVGVFEIAKKDYVSFATPQMYDNYINNRD